MLLQCSAKLQGWYKEAASTTKVSCKAHEITMSYEEIQQMSMLLLLLLLLLGDCMGSQKPICERLAQACVSNILPVHLDPQCLHEATVSFTAAAARLPEA